MESFSIENTRQIAAQIASKAAPGDIYCLTGELGVGKTIFAKGFAEGLGIKDIITSPTFTFVNEYDSGTARLYHFDVYRLEGEPLDSDDIGFSEYFTGDGICLIEWAEIIKDIIPSHATWITIERSPEAYADEGYRKITIN